MNHTILIDRDYGMTRVAVLEDGDLVEYYVEREGRCCMVGNIYVGRVQNVLPGMQAAFVDIGTDKNAFLYLGDEDTVDGFDYAFGSGTEKPAKKKIRSGQEILVQVVKEPEGQKGPRVTMAPTVPGHLLVLSANSTHVGVSRRIEEEEERKRLHGIAQSICPEGMGMILRTAAAGAAKEELADELRVLLAEWDVIVRKAKHTTPPKRIHREDSLLLRAVRDLFSANTHEMLIADEGHYCAVKEHIELRAPELLDRVRLYDKGIPLFASLGVESKADKALARKVWLKSGGYLVIDTTEAMTVIDVNSGKYTGKKDLQDTVFRVNTEAAEEVARQLRLRDVGGIIIIDFIDMEETARQEALVDTLRQALKSDRNRTNVVGLTGLGLVEMTRRKTRACLSKAVQRACPCCEGTGVLYAQDQIARKALRALSQRRQSGDEQRYRLSTSAEVAEAFERLGGASGVEVHAWPEAPHAEYLLDPITE